MARVLRLNPTSADCFVFTYKEGLLSAVAHDLKIRVTKFSIEVDTRARTVEGHFDARSLRVVCAMERGKEAPNQLSDDNKREIEQNIVRDVLSARKYPDIRFASTAVEERGRGFLVKGALSLHGIQKQVVVTVRQEVGRSVAEATVHQPDFGIRPYTALLGTLRIKPDVTVRIVVPA